MRSARKPFLALSLWLAGSFTLLFSPSFAAATDAGALEAALKESTTAYLHGDYREAARILEAAVGADTPFGVDAQSAPVALSSLGTLYWLQGRYAEAERILRRVVAGVETARGKQHPDVARELSRLGSVLRAQGRYREAESAYWRAIRVVEPQFGVDHAYVAECLYHLAELARLQGRLPLAESRYWRAYMIRSYLYGPESSPVGETVAGLAAVYRAQARDAEAETMYARALKIAEKPPRSDRTWGRLDERDLRELHAPERESIAVKGRIFVKDGGPRHLEYAQHFDSLGNLYRARGRFADAEVAYRRAIDIRSRAFGAEHPEIAQTHSNVALLHKLSGQVQKGLESIRAASGVLGRRITSHASEAYAEGERRRWRETFLLELSLLAADAGLGQHPADGARLAAAFAAIQYSNVGAGLEAPVSVAEVQKLLAHDEVLVASAADDTAAYVAIVGRDRAELRRIAPGAGPLSGLIQKELAGARALVVASEATRGTVPAVATLPTVNALRALKRDAK